MANYRLSNSGQLHDFDTLDAAQSFLDALDTRSGIEFVDAPKMFRLMNEVGAPLTTWRALVDEITNEFKSADFVEKRSALLALFKSTMDIVEARIGADQREDFRNTREQHYKTLIVQECLVNGNVSVEDLDAVTAREIAAGRMAPDSRLRQIALAGMAAPHLSRIDLLNGTTEPQAVPRLWPRILGWFGLR